LRELLTELAFVLLPRGMTPKRLSELLRSAFVEAAADISRLRNGKVNYSRVAAQTGLARADVKRVLSEDAFGVARYGQTAIERVIDAWRTDRQFSTGPERPKTLQIAGSKSSFARLVKKYGGDVPYRAVLDELRRIGAVRTNSDGICLQMAHVRRRYNFAFLSPVIPALIDGLRIAAKRSDSKASASIHRLSLPAETEVDLAIVRDRCTSGAQSLIDGLRHSLGTQAAIPKRRRRPGYAFTITVLLAETRATRLHRNRRVLGP
jgi:Family of unknown function (DUF6502)